MKVKFAQFCIGLRIMAMAVSVFFVATESLWALRLAGEDLSSKLPTMQSAEAGGQTVVEMNALEGIYLPESLGKIKRSFKGARKRLLIHIQDAHAHEEAQRKIGKILEYFYENQGLKLVNLEGAEGRLFTELFSFFPDTRARRNVADLFLSRARMGGAEHYAIVDRPKITLYGVEDKNVYEENRQAYLEAIRYRDRDREILFQLESVMDNIAVYVFPEELRALIHRKKQFHQEGQGLSGYVQYLIESAKKNNLALHDFPHLHPLTELIKLEASINFEEAAADILPLAEEIKKMLAPDRLSRFLTHWIQFRMEKISESSFHGFLDEEIKWIERTNPSQHDALEMRFKSALNLLRHSQLKKNLGTPIFTEIENLEKGLKNKLFDSPRQVQLDRLYHILAILKKMIHFDLSVPEADFFKRHRDEFSTKTFIDFLSPLLKEFQFSYGLPSQLQIFDQDLRRIERYYEMALKRDKILIEKAVEKMESEDVGIAALITGGFHTPGIERYLKGKDYSYVVIEPNLENGINPLEQGRLYEEAMQQIPLSLQRVLLDSCFMQDPVVFHEARFQLSIPPLTPSVEEGVRILNAFDVLMDNQNIKNIQQEEAIAQAKRYFEEDPQREVMVTALQLAMQLTLLLSEDPMIAHDRIRSAKEKILIPAVENEGLTYDAQINGFDTIVNSIAVFLEYPKGRKLMIFKPAFFAGGSPGVSRWFALRDKDAHRALKETGQASEEIAMSDFILSSAIISVDEIRTLLPYSQFRLEDIQEVNIRDRFSRLLEQNRNGLLALRAETVDVIEPFAGEDLLQARLRLNAIFHRAVELSAKRQDLLRYGSQYGIRIPDSKEDDALTNLKTFIRNSDSYSDFSRQGHPLSLFDFIAKDGRLDGEEFFEELERFAGAVERENEKDSDEMSQNPERTELRLIEDKERLSQYRRMIAYLRTFENRRKMPRKPAADLFFWAENTVTAISENLSHVEMRLEKTRNEIAKSQLQAWPSGAESLQNQT